MPRTSYAGRWGYRRTDLRHAEQYARRRHPSTTEGRWTTVDPLWPQESAYGYVRGNPVTLVDPSGAQIPMKPRPNPSAPKPPGNCRNWKDELAQSCTVAYMAHCWWCLGSIPKEAEEAEKKAGLPHVGVDGTRSNAFKHCFASCRAAEDCGCTCAEQASFLRENATFSNKEPDKTMDEHNDEWGRYLSTQKGSCAAKCLKALYDRKLIWVVVPR